MQKKTAAILHRSCFFYVKLGYQLAIFGRGCEKEGPDTVLELHIFRCFAEFHCDCVGKDGPGDFICIIHEQEK